MTQAASDATRSLPRAADGPFDRTGERAVWYISRGTSLAGSDPGFGNVRCGRPSPPGWGVMNSQWHSDMPITPLRVASAFLGLACGDALGAVLEFLPRDEVRRRHPSGLRDLVGGGAFGWRPGETTDDTAMALCVLRGILAAGGRDAGATAIVEAVGREFVRWFQSGPKDVGTTTALAISEYLRTGSWSLASARVRERLGDRTAGNGALMRTLPVAFFWPDDPEKTVVVARAIAWMTHPHPHAEWTAAAYSLYAAAILREGYRSGPEQWDRVLETLRQVAPDLPHDDPEWVTLTFSRVAILPEDVVRSTGYCVDTLEAALWALWTTRSFEACVVRAANLGGDADTVAAVAGGLAGAAYGLDGLPRRWREQLDPAVLRDVETFVGVSR